MSFEINRRQDFKNDLLLIDEIKRVIRTSYKEFDTLNGYLKKDLTDCNEIYTTIDEHGEVVGFFMVGLQKINGRQYYYLGLSSCRDDLKNKGIGKAMYLRFASDLKALENNLSERILCYWTTVSPIPYYWFCKNYIDVQPDINGDCRIERAREIQTIASDKYKSSTWDIDRPFILRKAVNNFKFNDKEKQRLKQATTDLNLNVFDKFGLDETHGDRFLMTGYVP